MKIKQVTPESELASMRLQRANLERYECLHALREYLLPFLDQATTLLMVREAIKTIRDTFFRDHCLLDFEDSGLVAEKKMDKLSIKTSKHNEMIIYQNILTIRSRKIHQEFGHTDEEKNTLEIESVYRFAKMLKSALLHWEYKFMGLLQKIDAASELILSMLKRSANTSFLKSFEIRYAFSKHYPTLEDNQEDYFIFHFANPYKKLDKYKLIVLSEFWDRFRKFPEYHNLKSVLGEKILICEYRDNHGLINTLNFER